MWLRYPLAVVGGYMVFLGQLRLWVEIERTPYDPKQVEIAADVSSNYDSLAPPPKKFISDGDSWLDWLDLPGSVLDFDEGCLMGCVFVFLIGMVTGAAGLLFSLIMTAPELLAEVFLDAVVVSLLYRHLKTAAKEHWLGTAVKRTWKSALLTAAVACLLGFLLAVLAPHSHSIGPALKEIFAEVQEKENG